MRTIKYVGAVVKMVEAGYSTNQITNAKTGRIGGLFVKRAKPFVSFSFYCDDDWNFDLNEIEAFMEKWKA